jgi:putative ABC transport system permease protein
MLGELRVALRALRRTPGVAISAVVCFAGAIGVATAVFAVVNGVVLRPLPEPRSSTWSRTRWAKH